MVINFKNEEIEKEEWLPGVKVLLESGRSLMEGGMKVYNNNTTIASSTFQVTCIIICLKKSILIIHY